MFKPTFIAASFSNQFHPDVVKPSLPLLQVGDWAVASGLFVQSGEPLRAAEITCKGKGEGWQDALADIAR